MATIDVAKSRIQAQNSKSIMEYTSTIQALMKIGRTEGLAALYNGFQPKALRMGIGGAVAVLLLRPCVRLLIRCR